VGLRPIRRTYRTVAVTFLFLLFVLQLVSVARVSSANWDEAHHLYDGYNVWTKHDYRLNAEVPPLVKLTAAIPLLPMHLYVPPNQGKSQGLEAFLDGKLFVFRNGGDRILFPARMFCMLFSLLLAALLYAATREMFGDVAALAALALFVFDPNVLAHGTLVSTDIGSACFIFATIYAFYRYTKAPTPARLAIVGLAAGLAMCAKFTGIFVAPMLVILAGADALLARSSVILWRRLAACAVILICAWAVIWAFYGFRYAPRLRDWSSRRRSLHTSLRCPTSPTLRNSLWSRSFTCYPSLISGALPTPRKPNGSTPATSSARCTGTGHGRTFQWPSSSSPPFPC